MKKNKTLFRCMLLVGITFTCLFVLTKSHSQAPNKAPKQTSNLNPSPTAFDVKQITSIKWNGTDGLPVVKFPGVDLGVGSFAILGKDNIAYLCNSSNEIIVVSLRYNKITSRFSVQNGASDFAYDNGNFYVLSDSELQIYGLTGRLITTIALEKPYTEGEFVIRFNNSTYILFSSGNSVLVESNGAAVTPVTLNGWMTNSGYRVETTGAIGQHSFSVKVITSSGHVFSSTYSLDKELVRAFGIGISNNILLMEVQTFISKSQVSTKIIGIPLNASTLGKATEEIEEPEANYVVVHREYYLSTEGVLYNLLTTAQGAYTFMLNQTTAKTGISGYPDSVTNNGN